jgi:hopene-associated glycosyltransferase HpnB
MVTVLRFAAWLAAAAWGVLLGARGRFWDARADRLAEPTEGGETPSIHAIVPARNEGDVIARTASALLAQRYPGPFAVTFVDDRSEDDTAAALHAAIARHDERGTAVLHRAQPRPEGWTGKLWAITEGIAAAKAAGAAPDYWWFSDADVEHDRDTLARLVATARTRNRDLVSLMVELHCTTPWERLLIPAFVYFFKMLYPFAWVNDDASPVAGAAGGCILIDAARLETIGGIATIRGELIDDCALATAVKRSGGKLFLDLTSRSLSVRPYDGLDPLWSMVARTAYTQLGYSPLNLLGTIAGMTLLYLVPLAAVLDGIVKRRASFGIPGALALGMMAFTFRPMVRRYRLPGWYALTLPLAGILYTLMTVDSAYRHARGAGGSWKGRTFKPTSAAPARPNTRSDA